MRRTTFCRKTSLRTCQKRDPAPGVGEAKYHGALKDLKKRLIQNALEEAHGSITEAAKALGVHPNYLHRLIRNLDLKETTIARGAATSDRRARAQGLGC